VRIGREMFLICCSPYPEREIELVAHLIAYDAADAYSRPAPPALSRRAAMLTPSAVKSDRR